MDAKHTNRIINCDCLDGMRQLPDECIPMVLTSCPYDNIREYGGNTFNFEPIAAELYRITMPGGVVVWIVQDQVKDGGFTGSSFRQALHFQELGFALHNTIIMRAINGRLPQRVRYTPQSHFAFVFSKGRPRYVNLIRDRRNKYAGHRKKHWFARQKNGTKTRGKSGKVVPPFGERGDVWTYVVGRNHTTKDKEAFEHPALMAEAMATDHILSWSRPGDLVFDPMCGSGTTCKMALIHNRRYLGMEIHKDYWEIAVRRLAKAKEEHRRKLDAWLFG